jgi:hypothetical protein
MALERSIEGFLDHGHGRRSKDFGEVTAVIPSPAAPRANQSAYAGKTYNPGRPRAMNIPCKCSSFGNPALEVLVTESGRIQTMRGPNVVWLNPDEEFVVAENGMTMSRQRNYRCNRCGTPLSFPETLKIAAGTAP